MGINDDNKLVYKLSRQCHEHMRRPHIINFTRLNRGAQNDRKRFIVPYRIYLNAKFQYRTHVSEAKSNI